MVFLAPQNPHHTNRAPLTDLPRAANPLDAATSLDGTTPLQGTNPTGFNRDSLILQNALLDAQARRTRMNANTEGLV